MRVLDLLEDRATDMYLLFTYTLQKGFTYEIKPQFLPNFPRCNTCTFFSKKKVSRLTKTYRNISIRISRKMKLLFSISNLSLDSAYAYTFLSFQYLLHDQQILLHKSQIISQWSQESKTIKTYSNNKIYYNKYIFLKNPLLFK